MPSLPFTTQPNNPSVAQHRHLILLFPLPFPPDPQRLTAAHAMIAQLRRVGRQDAALLYLQRLDQLLQEAGRFVEAGLVQPFAFLPPLSLWLLRQD